MKSMSVVIALSLVGCAGHRPPPNAAADDSFAVVDVRPQPHQSLRDRIVQEAMTAEAKGLAPLLELTSTWDRRCFMVDHSFDDAHMRAALHGTYIIRLDITRWVGRFGDTGLDRIPIAFPAFIELLNGGRVIGPYIDARSWIADAPTAVGPSLGAFVRSFASN
jgi:hypothetical protein